MPHSSTKGRFLEKCLKSDKVRKEIVRDSIVFRDRVVREDIYYEKPLTRWQKFRLSLGTVSLALIVIATLYLFLKFTNLLKLKL